MHHKRIIAEIRLKSSKTIKLVDQKAGFDRKIDAFIFEALNRKLRSVLMIHLKTRLFPMIGNKLVAIGRILIIVAECPDTLTFL